MAAISLFGRAVTEHPGKPVYDGVQKWNIATQSLCIIITTGFFGLRAYTRIFILNGFSKEDWFCFGAWFLGVCYSVIALIMGHFGGGLHINDVPKEHLIPFNKTVYVTMVMYGPTAYLTKLSLLWIMTRVFRPFRKSVIFIYIFLGLMLAYYVPAVIVKIRICNPIGKFWAKESPGSCLNQSAIIMADAVISVVSDMIVLMLPLPLTLRLQLPFKKKMRVMGILGAGGFGCACSIIRMVLIIQTGQSEDGTMSFMRINMFGNAEIAIGVICACLPALSALVNRAYTEYSSNKNSRSEDYDLSKYNGHGHSSPTGKSSKNRTRTSTIEGGSDKDMLMHNAQNETKIETTIQQDGSRRNRTTQFGIMKTVDLTTSVSSVK